MREVRCDSCGSSYYKVVYRIQGELFPGTREGYKITGDNSGLKALRIVRCLKCGLVYANPQESLSSIYGQYNSMRDEEYIEEERGRRKAADLILKKIERLVKPGRILDVGCATGFLLAEAKRRGWEPYGVELSPWAAKFAKDNFNLDIFLGALFEAPYPNEYFDAITLIDCIEHLPDPKKTLMKLRCLLKPNGLLCISTPDMESFFSRLLKARWWGIQQAHLYYFSRNTLTKLLDSIGFKTIRHSSHARIFSFRYWIKRFKGYNENLSLLLEFFGRYVISRESLFKINLNDQMEIFCKKKRTLLTLCEQVKPSGENTPKKLKTFVVLPAYNAEKTLELTVKDIPRDFVDEIILVDDCSRDNTVQVAGKLGLKVFQHSKNKGYGGNQKTCYQRALEMGAEIVVMVHPDYQYDPTIIPKLIEPIQKGEADCVFGSRMLKGGALEGGMPLWKHNVNILLTALENVVLGIYLSEYHSGFRAYSAGYLRSVNFMLNHDNFIFDTEIIVQGVLRNLKFEEVAIKTRYFEEASTIKFVPALIYGFGILWTLLKYKLHTAGVLRFEQFR